MQPDYVEQLGHDLKQSEVRIQELTRQRDMLREALLDIKELLESGGCVCGSERETVVRLCKAALDVVEKPNE